MKSIRITIAALLALTLTSCGVSTDTIKNAFISHAAFPSLAVAVQGCIAGRPDVQEAITPAWNRTFDKWEATKDLKPDANALKTIVGFPGELAEAERDALFIETVIINSGLDCGEFVRDEWGRVKVTFSEIKTAANSSQRFVLVADYASVISAILQGRKSGEVARMPS